MKLVLIVYNVGYDTEVRDILAELQVPGFTEVPLAFGTGESGKRYGSQIWPGHNRMLFTALTPEQADRLLTRLKWFKASLAEHQPRPGGVKAFVFPLDQVV